MLKLKKYKISRRFGIPLFEKCLSPKYALRTQRKKTKYRRAGSEFSQQLVEKQKLKIVYGIREKQLSNYIVKAQKPDGVSDKDSLMGLLESRLDNIVYRAGFASTRRAARQLVSHGHFCLNDRKMRIPSAQVKEGSIITIRDGSKNSEIFKSIEKIVKERKPPAFVEIDIPNKKITFKQKPLANTLDITSNLAKVFEYYNR